MISIPTQFLDLITGHRTDKSFAFAFEKFLRNFRTIANRNKNDSNGTKKHKNLIDQYIIIYYEKGNIFWNNRRYVRERNDHKNVSNVDTNNRFLNIENISKSKTFWTKHLSKSIRCHAFLFHWWKTFSSFFFSKSNILFLKENSTIL